MTANTRLTKEQKQDRKIMLNSLKEYDGEIASIGRFCVAKWPEFPNSKMSLFAFATCSDKERKNRRKVGEYFALNRLRQDESVKLPSFISAEEFARMLDELEYDVQLNAVDTPTGGTGGSFMDAW